LIPKGREYRTKEEQSALDAGAPVLDEMSRRAAVVNDQWLTDNYSPRPKPGGPLESRSDSAAYDQQMALLAGQTATTTPTPAPVANTSTAWDATVGIGTLAMGLATFVLAYQTWRLARQTRLSVDASTRLGETAERQLIEADAQTKLARLALESSVRPILADLPLGSGPARVTHTKGEVTGKDKAHVIISNEGEYVLCSLALRNVGSGVALIRGLGLRFDNDLGWSGKQTKAAVPPGEHTRFTFEIPKDRPELQEPLQEVLQHRVTLEVSYTDVNGGQATITRAHVAQVGSGLIRVRQISLFHAGGG
jgi:hypothetical protein